MALDIDFSALKPDDEWVVDLGAGVWLMDNHKWALVAWDRSRTAGQRYALLHADYHWDGVDNFASDPKAQQRLLKADSAALLKLVRAEKYIGYDSFIAPAVRRGLFSEVHFYCLEDHGTDAGLDEEVLQAGDSFQVIHDSPDSFGAVVPSSPIVFDLCLDLFNRSDDREFEGNLWADDDVVQFLDTVRAHLRDAAAITISLSFGYSGSEHDTRHLADLVVPRIVEMRRPP